MIESSTSSSLNTGLFTNPYRHFELSTLTIESEVLRSNPLGDSPVRYNPVLIPKGKAPAAGWPVVFQLAGFSGNGPFVFNLKSFEEGQPRILDRAVEKGEAPRAIYVFIDAMTSWGGSQFINSSGTGRYEDYIVKELACAVAALPDVSTQPGRWCVTGGSSGGYGALHLASSYPERFGIAAAVAPDCFFEVSLLTEFLTALPTLKKLGGVPGVKKELDAGRFMKRRDAHTVLNAICMGLCYAPDDAGGFELPVDRENGRVLPEIFAKYRKRDPIEFLVARKSQVSKIKSIYLDVGTRDQFYLQYGARQIRDVLTDMRASLTYQEFDGNHFEIGDRRPEVWKWLLQELNG